MTVSPRAGDKRVLWEDALASGSQRDCPTGQHRRRAGRADRLAPVTDRSPFPRLNTSPINDLPPSCSGRHSSCLDQLHNVAHSPRATIPGTCQLSSPDVGPSDAPTSGTAPATALPSGGRHDCPAAAGAPAARPRDNGRGPPWRLSERQFVRIAGSAAGSASKGPARPPAHKPGARATGQSRRSRSGLVCRWTGGPLRGGAGSRPRNTDKLSLR